MNNLNNTLMQTMSITALVMIGVFIVIFAIIIMSDYLKSLNVKEKTHKKSVKRVKKTNRQLANYAKVPHKSIIFTEKMKELGLHIDKKI